MTFLIIGLGGFLGAISRYSCSLLFPYEGGFPYSTLFVNVVGCLLLSFLQLVIKPNEILWFFFVTGFLGSLTTFSAFGWETYRLLQAQNYSLAATNIFLNLSLGIIVFFLPFFFVKPQL